MSDPNALQCVLCSAEVNDYLGDHLVEVHGMSVQEYLAQHPGAPTVTPRLWGKYQDSIKDTKRAQPPPPDELTLTLAKVKFKVNADVPEEACLPLPPFYKLPEHGELGEDVAQSLISLARRRSIYVWGMPGTGKDALFHAYSNWTRSPAILLQVQPGSDPGAWFFSRGFNEKGTFWEEGEVLKALRDGYITSTGRRLPYLILITDFDRADREQAEHLRLITDSIQGRVSGPAGTTFRVVPGTIIVATANTAGGGDERGRMTSANVIDASLLNRFERKFEFRYMDWKDEAPILQRKFPLLLGKAPSILAKMEQVTANLRDAIAHDDLHGEFSHRDLCHILAHAEDIMIVSGRLDQRVLKWASRAWVDGLPDAENRLKARNIMDPKLGIVSEGDTGHISQAPLKGAVGKARKG